MASPNPMTGNAPTTAHPIYSGIARMFHWITVGLIVVMFATGQWMTWRGDAGVWDATTNNLYSTHKLFGITLLLLVLVRLSYRLVRGAPHHAATLSRLQAMVSEVVHYAIYALLLIVPLLGWLGVSLFPALDIFGLFKLPTLMAPDQAFAKTIFGYHEIAGKILLGLVAMHVGAALMHLIIFKDGVFQRMLPTKAQKQAGHTGAGKTGAGKTGA